MKLNKLTLFSVFALSISSGLLSCKPAQPTSRVKQIVEEAQKMSREELYKKAAAELGSQTFHWLATSSRGGKNEVKDAFVAALNKAAGTSITRAQIDYQTTVDGRIYTILNGDNESGTPTFSGALLQDGYQLQTKGIEKGYVNYIPKEWAEHNGVNPQRDGNPFTLQFQFKTWMYNNHNGDQNFDNVWDFAKTGVTIDTMDPTNENVNMDWLIQLTSDENCLVLKQAFEDTATNDSGIAASELEKYATYGGNRKYAFLFIEKFIKNAAFANDDGAALDSFSQSPGHAAWIVYSKIMKLEETAQISKKDVIIAALGKTHSDGKNPGQPALKGFAGFMYKHYLMLMPNAPLPWTACAFINFLSTTGDGYQGWKGDVGDYPSFGEEINKDRSKLGWVDGHNEYPCLNDPSSNWWINTAKSPVETPSYIAPVYNTVAAFIMQQIAKKK